jgi:hypothetical protein
MMQKVKTGLALIVLSFVSVGALAQEQQKTSHRFPRWVSEKGYWVVETNLNSPLNHRVSFYNNNNVLLYSKALSGVKLDPNRRKIKMKLKKELESAVVAFERKKKETELVKTESSVHATSLSW